jgi:hypothetical protein
MVYVAVRMRRVRTLLVVLTALSWRVAPDGTEPVEVRFDGGTLALPR